MVSGSRVRNLRSEDEVSRSLLLFCGLIFALEGFSVGGVGILVLVVQLCALYL